MFFSRPKAQPLAELLNQCRRAFWVVVGATMLAELLSVAPILYTLNMYDRVMTSRSEVTLISLTVLIMSAYAFWGAIEWFRGRLLIRISMRIDWDLASKVFDASFRRFIGRKEVNVHQVMGDLVTLRQFLTGAPMLALVSAPFALFFIIFGAFFHPYLALFCLVASTLLLVATFVTNKATTPLLKEANTRQGESNMLAAQCLSQSETALGLGMHATLRSRWYHAHQKYLGLQANASEAQGVLGGVSGYLAKAFPSLQIALGVYLAIEGLITGGMVIAASFLISKAIAPLQKVMGSWNDIAAARQAYERLDALLAEDESWQDQLELPAPEGNLSVEGLFVQPPGATEAVLQNINFKLAPGDALAIIGPSAAGKSTLIRMLIGLWHPKAGHVRLDGAEIHDWVRATAPLGAHIGYLPQDTVFFAGTVAENIARMTAPDAEKVIQAAKLAGVHETILSFPHGYETRLSDAGHALTGGQRQRIALARALYGNPRYLVLDEPNSALDEASERSLVQTLANYRAAGNTVVFSTHRPMLLAASTKLLVLNNGRQAALGPTKDVVAALNASQQDAKQ